MQEFSISDTRITAKLKGQHRYPTCTTSTCSIRISTSWCRSSMTSGIITAYNYHADHSTNWPQLLPYVLAFFGLILLMNLFGTAWPAAEPGRRQAVPVRSFRRSACREKRSRFRMGGADEEKEELREIVGVLREPQKYLDLLGGRISPRACCCW